MDDYISRNAAIEKFRGYKLSRDIMTSHNTMIDFAISLLYREIPTANVVEKAEWDKLMVLVETANNVLESAQMKEGVHMVSEVVKKELDALGDVTGAEVIVKEAVTIGLLKEINGILYGDWTVVTQEEINNGSLKQEIDALRARFLSMCEKAEAKGDLK